MIYEDGLDERFGIKTVEARVSGIRVESSGVKFQEFKARELARLRGELTLEDLKDRRIFRLYRDFYWRIGIDPTKIRPSSEALVRRILQGKELPSINNCVDSYNLASAVTFIPMGAYDISKLEGELRIRRSNGEEFQGIGGKTLTTSGEIVMADDEKLVNIFPYRDADESKITSDTTDILIVVCGIQGIDRAYLRDSASRAVEMVTRFCGGEGRPI
jgi:DNA/RNA-binding domain of Phe-tRNA-synthetase-like protein